MQASRLLQPAGCAGAGMDVEYGRHIKWAARQGQQAAGWAPVPGTNLEDLDNGSCE